jgi:protein arginine kinase activator
MLCENCHQNLATVHLTEIIQKYKKETHLCEECAKSRGVPYKPQPFSVKEFLGGVGKAKPLAESEAGAKAETALPVKAETDVSVATNCPRCGISFADFRSSGRLGCHECYDHFKTGLTPLLEKIHSSTQHTGRVPSRLGERLEKERMLGAYQRQLDDAIRREEYERAAELRDKIRELSGEPS